MLGKRKAAAEVDPDLLPFPWELDYLWSFFHEFGIGLKADGMGPVMASWRDVQDWCAAMRLDLEPWEKKTLVRLANLRAALQSEEMKKDADARARANKG